MKKFSNVAKVLLALLLFVTFFNGYSAEGPSRKKFKKLGEGVEDLIRPEAAPEVDRLKAIAGDKRFRPWVEWWQKCAPGFTLSNMDDIGQLAFYDETITPLTTGQMGEGPGSKFFFRAPGGKQYLNPYHGRLLYRKEGEAWQPYVELRCGVALYMPSEKKARNVFECSALEGIDDAFWLDKNTFVLMGYASLTRQMNVECEGLQSCVAPTVWIGDLRTGYVNEQRGKVIKRKECELGGYLKVRWPDFFCEKECEKNKK